MEYIHKEFTRKKNLDYDVVVVGGGLAGLTAAIASARHGAKTAIIQDRPVFGGNASSEIRMHICGASENQKKPEYEEGGILHEIMLLNKSRNDSFNYSVWDMTLYEVVKSQQNLTAYLNTTMLDCEVSDGSIGSVRCYQLTTETFYTIHAQIFIDCTGIGTLAMKSGAVFMTGSEGRRIIGDYILTENDILEKRRFYDGVTYGGWAMDVHTPGGLYDFDKRPSQIRCFDGVYEIPYRCFYSRNIKNLMMAGKIISASKLGISSTRVMGTCAAGGQAAGTAAAMCVRKGLPPRRLLPFVGELRRELVKDDCFIPGFSESDGDLLIGAEVFTPSFRAGHEPGLIANGSARNGLFISNGVSDASEIIRIVPTRAISVDELRITFDSCFERAIKITLSDKRRAQQLPGVPPELVKDYRVELLYRGRKVAERMVEGNFERLNILVFDGILTDEIRLAIFSTNGCPDARIFRIAAYENEDR